MKIRVLGSCAGGRLPQWNCGGTNSVRARAGDPAVPPRTQPSIAVSADVEVGIDLEPIDRDVHSILSQFATPDEIELVNSFSAQQPDEAWPTRLWCAKEAVGKVLGTGLGGRPKDFTAVELSPEGRLLMHHVPTGSTYVVTSVRVNEFVVAYTSALALVADPVPAA